MRDVVMDFSVLQLSAAYVSVFALLLIFKARGIKRERQILIATTRMTLQLTVMGYILVYVFANPSWWLTLVLIVIMVAFAIYNVFKRVPFQVSAPLKKLTAMSVLIGYAVTAAAFIVGILQVRPWFTPQYFIPISGMIVGNSMTAITLGVNRLCSEMRDKRAMVENSLMLGATPRRATRDIVNSAFDSAILPTMNNMMTMGVVSLPGMMTGQILSGTFPLTAIKYQIGIMLAILGCTAITVVLFVTLGYKTFFSKDGRLLAEDDKL